MAPTLAFVLVPMYLVVVVSVAKIGTDRIESEEGGFKLHEPLLMMLILRLGLRADRATGFA